MDNAEIKNVLERIETKAEKKKFGVCNSKEWYFVSGIWIAYILRNIKSKTLRQGLQHEAVRICAKRNEKFFKSFLCKIFKKECTLLNTTDKADGVLYGILSYTFEPDEERFDGKGEFIQGLCCVGIRL